MSASTSPVRNAAPPPPLWPAHLISTLLIVVGLGGILLFVLSIARDSGIQLAVDWVASEEIPEEPSLILVFLERFGLVVPFLVLYLGGLLALIGWRVRNASIQVAHWARTALLWLALGLVVWMALEVYNILHTAYLDKEVVDLGDIFSRIFPALIGAIFFGAVWWWLDHNIGTYFIGEDPLIAREARLAWNLLIPTLAIFVIVSARPLEQTFIRSLTDKKFAGRDVPQFVGLDNYTHLLGFRVDVVDCRKDDADACATRDNGSIRWESIDRDLLEDGYRTVWNINMPFASSRSYAISGLDKDFLQAIVTTLTFAIFSVTGELLIGLFMAMVVNSSFRGRGMMRAVMLVPWAIPTVISAKLWETMLKDTSAGVVNKVLMDLHVIDVPVAWLSEASLQLPTAIIVDVWKTAPFMALLLLAGLQTIPSDLYEAASVDGANPVRRFFSITLPLLRPAIAIALVFRTLDALRVFDLFNVLFGRQQLSMATYNFETLVNNQLDGYASAVSVIIFFFISIFAFVYVRMLNVETD